MSFLPSETSRPSILHGYVKDYMAEMGDTVTYKEVLGLFDMDLELPEPARLLSKVIDDVNRRLHRDGDWRWLINVERIGYRIATPEEVRLYNFAGMRRRERQQVRELRATETIIRNPSSTPGERKRAADAAASQAALLQLMRREQRKIKRAWPAEEVSPVPSEEPVNG